jgi:hypothetical protein
MLRLISKPAGSSTSVSPKPRGSGRQNQRKQECLAGDRQPLQGEEIADGPQQTAEGGPPDPESAIGGVELRQLLQKSFAIEQRDHQADGQVGEEEDVAETDRILRTAAAQKGGRSPFLQPLEHAAAPAGACPDGFLCCSLCA